MAELKKRLPGPAKEFEAGGVNDNWACPFFKFHSGRTGPICCAPWPEERGYFSTLRFEKAEDLVAYRTRFCSGARSWEGCYLAQKIKAKVEKAQAEGGTP